MGYCIGRPRDVLGVISHTHTLSESARPLKTCIIGGRHFALFYSLYPKGLLPFGICLLTAFSPHFFLHNTKSKFFFCRSICDLERLLFRLSYLLVSVCVYALCHFTPNCVCVCVSKPVVDSAVVFVVVSVVIVVVVQVLNLN